MLTTCWPNAATAAKERIPTTRNAAFDLSFKLFVRIVLPPWSVRLIDHKFPGIHQHHHQHAAGESVARSDLALVVRVPHEGKPRLAGGRVCDRPRRWSHTGGAGRTNRRIRPEVGTAAVPGAVRLGICILVRRRGGGGLWGV